MKPYFKLFSIFTLYILLCTAISSCDSQKRVKGGDVTLTLSDDGDIVAVKFGSEQSEFNGRFHIANTFADESQTVSVKKLPKGGYEFTRSVVCDSIDNGATIVQRYIPTESSVRMEIEITSTGDDWGSDLNSIFTYPASDDTRFWTAWANPMLDDSSALSSGRDEFNKLRESTQRPEIGNDTRNPELDIDKWIDPLVPISFSNVTWSYGMPHITYDVPTPGRHRPYKSNIFAIPMATILLPEKDQALTIALSPDDIINDMELSITAEGGVTLRRMFNRISKDKPLCLSLDFVTHQADWRSAMAWFSDKYAKYFTPHNDLAQQMSGTSAYVREHYNFDVDSLKKMAFAMNWHASFDFPYMGMFLPPIAQNEQWTDLTGRKSSAKQMNDYAGRMKEHGFYITNYFNVTEFGNNMIYPRPKQVYSKDDPNIWKNANDMMYHKYPSAVLVKPERNIAPGEKRDSLGVPYWSWEKCWAIDVGDPAYQQYIVDQAKRHLDYIPNASGITIDRTDWTQMYNENADDGISWYAGAPARYLNTSWKQIMSRLGPMFHNAGKCIFINNYTCRIDQHEHSDGFFCEFADAGPALNATGLLAIKKPALGWIHYAWQVVNGGYDYFLQKYIYMGVFPMAPIFENDHAIQNNLPEVNHLYMEYGNMLQQMKGREWVLQPHVIKVLGNSAKANIFKTPTGYILPIVFGLEQRAIVQVKDLIVNPQDISCTVTYPGKEPAPINYTHENSLLTFDVPLERECAMVAIKVK